MKKLTIFSEESIFSGSVKCGIAEVVDSLANALASDYEVSIICLDGEGESGRLAAEFVEIEEGINYTKFLKVNYFLINKKFWPYKGIKKINDIAPDILHNFYEPELILKLYQRPNKLIFTFDDVKTLYDNKEILKQYDSITSFSKGYVDEILEKDKSLLELNLERVSIGILNEFFTPEKGILLPTSFNFNNQQGKELCKRRFLEKNGIKNNPCVFLTMCRLTKEKGIESILKSMNFFKQKDVILIIIGTGEKKYEDILSTFSLDDNVLFIKNRVPIPQIVSIMAGADFYLQPSLKESGGIMPMIASAYGTVPIVTQNGGLLDNFNTENSIIVENNNVSSSLEYAFELYNNKEKLYQKRKQSMIQDYSWRTRKYEFIQIYEQN